MTGVNFGGVRFGKDTVIIMEWEIDLKEKGYSWKARMVFAIAVLLNFRNRVRFNFTYKIKVLALKCV